MFNSPSDLLPLLKVSFLSVLAVLGVQKGLQAGQKFASDNDIKQPGDLIEFFKKQDYKEIATTIKETDYQAIFDEKKNELDNTVKTLQETDYQALVDE